MSRRLVFVIGAGFALSGCCLGSGCYIEPKARKKSEAVASDDASPKEADLATLRPYSEEWWSVRDAIDRADELKLSKKLIICRGCVPSQPDDHTASITAK